MTKCNIKITGYAIIETEKWNKIIKQTTMNQQPNPALRNTAVYVGNDETLRKKAIEYYEANGFNKYGATCKDEDYVFARDTNYFMTFAKDEISNFESLTIITLPTETESEYPKMMLVRQDEEDWQERLIVCFFEGKAIAQSPIDLDVFYAWNFAKPLPTTTLTVAELVEFYEKSNNFKVEIV